MSMRDYLEQRERDLERRVASLEADNRRLREALQPFAATADKLDAVRDKSSWMSREYEAAASVVGWKYEDAARARSALRRMTGSAGNIRLPSPLPPVRCEK